jgi:hypothetical protein
MKLEDVQRNPEKKIVRVNIRATLENSEWIKENNISPQLLFDKALESIKEQVKGKI